MSVVNQVLAKNGVSVLFIAFFGNFNEVFWLHSRRFLKNFRHSLLNFLARIVKVDEYRFDCSGSYEPLVYCVQYRESELNFISRLLEAEGIFYYFEHSEEKHVIVFADESSALSDIDGEPEVAVNIMS